MTNTPTVVQVENSKTWTELYNNMGVNLRNTRAHKIIQEDVKKYFPDSVLVQKPRYGNISDETVKQLVETSVSVKQIIERGGWKPSGAMYKNVYDRINKLQLNVSHFTGQAHGRGKSSNKSLSEYLVKDSHIHSHALKLKLIAAGVKEYKCEICNMTEWMGQKIPIALDHINGDHSDNQLSNIRIVCPNCHAQTPTYCGKNKKEKCPVCKRPKKLNSNRTCGSIACMEQHLGHYKHLPKL